MILNTKGKPINLTLLPNPIGMAKRLEKGILSKFHGKIEFQFSKIEYL